jgi:predicted acylesterase/phospholipase RssA
MIEHVVLSGCGPNGYIQLGFVAELLRSGHLDPTKLKSVHATSGGSSTGLFLILGISIEEYIDYMVERPWSKWFTVNVLDVNANCGLLPWEKIYDFYRPLLVAKGFDDTLTLKELYDRTHVDFHVYTTELESFQYVDLNHATFPDLPLHLALCMTASAFPVFAPIEYQGKHYTDGDFRMHFPIDELLKTKPDLDTILGVNICGEMKDYVGPMSAVETGLFLMGQAATSICKGVDYTNFKYYFGHPTVSAMEMSVWQSFLTDIEFRRQRVADGRALAVSFIQEKFVEKPPI